MANNKNKIFIWPEKPLICKIYLQFLTKIKETVTYSKIF